jgi:endonuclease/exonuclease/phosphatase family metal-dependent hydrolase
MKKRFLLALLLTIAISSAYITQTRGSDGDDLKICSFNIQFLGHFKDKENRALADILKDYDIVVVQELVAPPIKGTYPDGEIYLADTEAELFFKAMENLGFTYKLSEEDTGTNDEIHKKTSATEWWVAFYDPNSVEDVNDLPSGFLADDRSNHPCYERVPYAFGFRTCDEKTDFVLISVHLKPGSSSNDKARRKHELTAIFDWVNQNDGTEKDYIILGDMNIEDPDELASVTPEGYLSLNDECLPTNTSVNSPKPYDHVMYNVTDTNEINTEFDIKIIDLIEAMRPYWQFVDEAYPGDPYEHNRFRIPYSDHHPVVFEIKVPDTDDD